MTAQKILTIFFLVATIGFWVAAKIVADMFDPAARYAIMNVALGAWLSTLLVYATLMALLEPSFPWRRR